VTDFPQLFSFISESAMIIKLKNTFYRVRKENCYDIGIKSTFYEVRRNTGL